ncbi:uncharacterized protein ACBR49_013285 isoform 2-T3 [Aulostomus maculatus]
MPSMQVLRACVSQRMAAAVEEIMGMFESAIGEYEAEMSRRWLLGDAALPDTEIDPRRGASQHIQPATSNQGSNPAGAPVCTRSPQSPQP